MSPRRLLVAAALVAGLLPLVAVPSSSAGSSLCGPGKTALGGSMKGHPDGAAINASVNIELTNSAVTRAYDVFSDGRVDTVGHAAGTRYSYVDHVNRDLVTGSPAPAHAPLDRTWGAPGKAGVLCFTSNPRITHAYIEIYPRRPIDDNGDGIADRHVTDRSRYGAAAHYRQPVRAGADNAGIVLRVPQNNSAYTGVLHGFITYKGKAVPPAAADCGKVGRPACNGITAVRAFPLDTVGTNCGVEGFSASGDGLDPRAKAGAATYYRINALAGGRCGATYQSYSPRVTCVSFCGRNAAGGLSRSISPSRMPPVRSGVMTQADFSFG